MTSCFRKVTVTLIKSQNSKFKKEGILDTSLKMIPKTEIIPSINRKVIASKRFPLFLQKQYFSKLKTGVKICPLSKFQYSTSQRCKTLEHWTSISEKLIFYYATTNGKFWKIIFTSIFGLVLWRHQMRQHWNLLTNMSAFTHNIID